MERWLALSEQDKLAMRNVTRRCFERRYEASLKASEMIEVFRAHGITG